MSELESVNCWENLYYSLLCLEDDQFDIIVNTDQKKKIVKVEDIANNIEKLEKGQSVDTGDKYLNEIEKALSKGDMASVDALLKNMK